MRVLSLDKCEWAVNTLGNVLVSCPRFHAREVRGAHRRGGFLVFLHDAGGETAVPVPAAVDGYLPSSATVLLVAFSAGGNVVEMDVPLVRPEEPGTKEEYGDA